MEKYFPLYMTETELSEIQICVSDRITKLKADQKKKDLTQDQSAGLFSSQAVCETVREKTSMLLEYVQKNIDAETAKREAARLKSLYERFAMRKDPEKT